MRAMCSMALVVLALCGSGCAGAVPEAKPGPVAKSPGGKPPAWLPAYTAEQRALLRPPDEPIKLPATRVFPDLGRFAYGRSHRMEGPEEGLRFAKMVVSVLNDSPRFYVIGEAGPELANHVAQYGPAPAPEPDPWMVLKREEGGGRLVQAPLDEEARAAFARGEAAQKARDAAGARAAFEEAAAKSPRHPAVLLALGHALAAGGDLAGAEKAFDRALVVDPTLASAYVGLAEVHEKRGDLEAARRHATEALAYHPSSRAAHAIASRLAPGGAGSGRIEPFAIFLDVDDVGAVHVASAPSGPAQIYGGCRAILRYEPEVRSVIFEQPVETPYYLSVVEEVVCLEAAIGAYFLEQAEAAGAVPPDSPREPEPREAEPDPRLEALARLAHEDGLAGYVMFEILGRHRPERARGAPPDLHRAVVRYVDRHVLGLGNVAAPDGVYTAQVGFGAEGAVRRPGAPNVEPGTP